FTAAFCSSSVTVPDRSCALAPLQARMSAIPAMVVTRRTIPPIRAGMVMHDLHANEMHGFPFVSFVSFVSFRDRDHQSKSPNPTVICVKMNEVFCATPAQTRLFWRPQRTVWVFSGGYL